MPTSSLNARFHDTNFARLELLKLLAEDDDVWVRVGESFADTEAIRASDVLVTYTCDLRPEPEEEEALRAFVEGGGRWLALHATNALLDFGPEGIIAPRICDTFMDTMGSRFISHPPIQPFQVTVSAPDHPLVAGIEPFEASDEIYLCEYTDGITPLLETRFSGTFEAGYVENDWPDDDPRLIAYLRELGAGRRLLPDSRPLLRQVRHAAHARGDRGRARLLEPPRLLRPPPPRPGVGEGARAGAGVGSIQWQVTPRDVALRGGELIGSRKQDCFCALSTYSSGTPTSM